MNLHAPIPKANKSTETGKRLKTQVNPFTMYLDINSLEVHKKQKHSKYTIKTTLQSCLYLAIEKKKDKIYQSACKEKLGKIIQSLMSIDETTSIVK